MEGMEGMEGIAHNPPALKQQRDRAKKAFSLVEAAIVLGVVGLVIGGIWVAASTVMFNLKWEQTEKGWIYYMDEVMKTFDSRTVAKMGYQNISPWLESTTKPPAGWTGARYDPGSSLTYRIYDPFGNQIYPPETDIFPGDIPVVGFNYADPLPKEQCARIFVLAFQKIARKHNLIYSGHGAGCDPDGTKNFDYYMNSSCCPGRPQLGWEAPMR